MRVSESADVYHDGDHFVCPLCTRRHASILAAAACDCDDEEYQAHRRR